MGLFQDPVKTFPSVLFLCLMGKKQWASQGDVALRSLPVAPLPLHLHLRKGEECWQAERGWGQRVEGWIITRKKIGASYLLSEQVLNTVWPKHILSHSVSYANATSRNQPATKVDSASRLHSTCP